MHMHRTHARHTRVASTYGSSKCKYAIGTQLHRNIMVTHERTTHVVACNIAHTLHTHQTYAPALAALVNSHALLFVEAALDVQHVVCAHVENRARTHTHRATHRAMHTCDQIERVLVRRRVVPFSDDARLRTRTLRSTRMTCRDVRARRCSLPSRCTAHHLITRIAL
jgi:hypothetical protein